MILHFDTDALFLLSQFSLQWHLGFAAKEYLPTHRGFDSFYGYYSGGTDYWDHLTDGYGPKKTYWGLDMHHDINVSICPTNRISKLTLYQM